MVTPVVIKAHNCKTDNFADLADFTDEEGYGKFLDLHECYVKFINLKGMEVMMC